MWHRLDSEKGSVCQELVFPKQWSFIQNSSEGYTSHCSESYPKITQRYFALHGNVLMQKMNLE